MYFDDADNTFQTLASTGRIRGHNLRNHPYLGVLINSCVEFKMKRQKSELALNIIQVKVFINQWLFKSHKKISEVH